MKNEALKSKYLEFIKNESSRIDTPTSKMVTEIANYILDFIIGYTDIDALTEMEFGTIKDLVHSNDVKTIKYTLHLMALKPYDVLVWKSYVETDDFYEPERIYIDNVELATMLRTKEFYNPFTNKKVSKEEFSHLINTVFGVSQNFKNTFKTYKD